MAIIRRNELPKDIDPAAALSLSMLLHTATAEGKAAAADLCSVRLENLANHAANAGFSAAEIVELIREEAAAIESKGGAAWN